MNRNVLISGASVAGPALAFWLQRYGFKPTIVERSGTVRSGGYPIDIRGIAVDVIERMGVLPQIRAAHIDTRYATAVAGDGRRIGRMSTGEIGGSGGLELPRGSLTSVLYDQSRDDVEYVFDDSITSIEQADGEVHVTFARGAARTFGMVVGADGLHSNVRRLTFGREEPYRRYLGYCFAGFSMDNEFGLDSEVVLHNVPGRMTAVYAVRGMAKVHVLLAFAAPEQSYERLDAGRQLQLVEDAFGDAGWRVPRLLEAMRVADDLFFDSISQIRMPHWTKHRIALVGDAAYAPSFLSGQGTSLALVAAYVLAGELALAKGNHVQAFANYERTMRPFVETNQRLAVRGAGAIMIPTTRAGLWLRNRALAFAPLLSRLPINLDAGVQRAANAIALADYPMPTNLPD